jgi:hypothetical protein
MSHLDFFRNKTFYKITNALENHHGFQYVNGLNVLEEEFSEIGSCVPGGLYFTDEENIEAFSDYGIFRRDITCPVDNHNFKVVLDSTYTPRKWRANMLHLGKRAFHLDSRRFSRVFGEGKEYQPFVYMENEAISEEFLDHLLFLVNNSNGSNKDSIYKYLLNHCIEMAPEKTRLVHVSVNLFFMNTDALDALRGMYSDDALRSSIRDLINERDDSYHLDTRFITRWYRKEPFHTFLKEMVGEKLDWTIFEGDLDYKNAIVLFNLWDEDGILEEMIPKLLEFAKRIATFRFLLRMLPHVSVERFSPFVNEDFFKYLLSGEAYYGRDRYVMDCLLFVFKIAGVNFVLEGVRKDPVLQNFLDDRAAPWLESEDAEAFRSAMGNRAFMEMFSESFLTLVNQKGLSFFPNIEKEFDKDLLSLFVEKGKGKADRLFVLGMSAFAKNKVPIDDEMIKKRIENGVHEDVFAEMCKAWEASRMKRLLLDTSCVENYLHMDCLYEIFTKEEIESILLGNNFLERSLMQAGAHENLGNFYRELKKSLEKLPGFMERNMTATFLDGKDLFNNVRTAVCFKDVFEDLLSDEAKIKIEKDIQLMNHFVSFEDKDLENFAMKLDSGKLKAKQNTIHSVTVKNLLAGGGILLLTTRLQFENVLKFALTDYERHALLCRAIKMQQKAFLQKHFAEKDVNKLGKRNRARYEGLLRGH